MILYNFVNDNKLTVSELASFLCVRTSRLQSIINNDIYLSLLQKRNKYLTVEFVIALLMRTSLYKDDAYDMLVHALKERKGK